MNTEEKNKGIKQKMLIDLAALCYIGIGGIFFDFGHPIYESAVVVAGIYIIITLWGWIKHLTK